ncbi:MAG: ACP S-malonyltransferase [Hydrogenibacillus sp.]|nr:ACP S-malonyltransferase [Hydrogenibacillus sp.]
MSVAYVFPGQGSQAVGMLRDVYERSAEGRAMIEAADRTLGFALSALMFEGPEETLRETENAQPALFVAGAVLYTLYRRALEASAPETPAFVAGHSLGQYTALFAAGALDFEEGVRLVRRRGELMKAAGRGRGTMAAVLGADEATVREVLAALPDHLRDAGEIVEAANMNGPGQIVLSGTEAALAWAEQALRGRGVRRVIRLNVSGPFHSSLMAGAAASLREALTATDWKPPAVPVVDNVTAEALPFDALIDRLAEQVMRPVRWEASVRVMVAAGVRRFIEFGPGNVLSGLIRRIAPDVEAMSLSALDDLERYAGSGR